MNNEIEIKNSRRDWTIVIAAALGAALCLYQWAALYSLRTEGTAPGCAVNEAVDCAVVWNAPLSLQVQQLTGLPFPAWGLAWCLVMIGLTLPRVIRPSGAHGNRTFALRLLSTIAAAGCVALVGYTFHIGVLCPTCLLFYVAVAVVTYFAWRRPDPSAQDPLLALLHAGGWMAGAVVLLVYPALQTPVAQLTQALPAAERAAPQAQAAPEPAGEDPVQRLFASLNPQIKQLLSNALGEYKNAPLLPREAESARVSFGDPASPVRIVEWVDLMCPHCRQLHQAFDEIMSLAPTGWSLETRFFPLDGVCNPGIQRRTPDGTRCLAAKMLLCAGATDRKSEIALRSEIFENQQQLNPDLLWKLAERHLPDSAGLKACVDSEATEKQLLNDIEYANTYGIEGTPFTAVNGKAAPAIPALLYTLILTGGSLDHPALNTLPPAQPMH